MERSEPPVLAADRCVDRLEIADLLSRYAFHFDRNEPELVARLFTSDAVIDYGPELEPIRGRDQIVPRIAPGLRSLFRATSHHISNVLVDFEGSDVASVVAYVYAWHRYCDGSPDGHLWGQYHVRARRGSEGWRMSEMVLQAVAVEEFHRSRMHPIARRAVPDRPAEPGH